MREEFKVVQYERKSGPKYNLDFLNLESAKKVQSFHASFPVYKETPLVELKHTACLLYTSPSPREISFRRN